MNIDYLYILLCYSEAAGVSLEGELIREIGSHNVYGYIQTPSLYRYTHEHIMSAQRIFSQPVFIEVPLSHRIAKAIKMSGGHALFKPAIDAVQGYGLVGSPRQVFYNCLVGGCLEVSGKYALRQNSASGLWKEFALGPFRRGSRWICYTMSRQTMAGKICAGTWTCVNVGYSLSRPFLKIAPPIYWGVYSALIAIEGHVFQDPTAINGSICKEVFTPGFCEFVGCD